MTSLFWICFAIIVYTFLGYGVLLLILVCIKRFFSKIGNVPDAAFTPTCAVVIAAYNEEAFIREKIKNTLALNYPDDRLKIFIVADGSTDRTLEIINEYPDIHLLYVESRKGKVHAINRAMQYIDSEVVVFTDANTYLNKEAVRLICSHYQESNVGGVAGEKRIFADKNADASSAGESLYWKYESTLKKWDSELNTAIGAAGELFSIRRRLYEPIPESIILDDFIISMTIAQKGYRIIYESKAYAIETSSSNIQEELKRKVRIAAGGLQSIILLKSLFNITRHPLLSFQYISHRVLRWSITPFFLILIFLANTIIISRNPPLIYEVIWYSQIGFYLLAVLGFVLEKRKLKMKAAFVPYYFCVMNYSIILGILKYLKKEQSPIWDKSERQQHIVNDILTNEEL